MCNDFKKKKKKGIGKKEKRIGLSDLVYKSPGSFFLFPRCVSTADRGQTVYTVFVVVSLNSVFFSFSFLLVSSSSSRGFVYCYVYKVSLYRDFCCTLYVVRLNLRRMLFTQLSLSCVCSAKSVSHPAQTGPASTLWTPTDISVLFESKQRNDDCDTAKQKGGRMTVAQVYTYPASYTTLWHLKKRKATKRGFLLMYVR